MVSGTISLFCLKCFSPFLHSTGSLSVSREYLALPDGPGGFTQDSSCPALLRIPLGDAILRVRDCHPLWWVFPNRFSSSCILPQRGPTTPMMPKHHRFGLFPVRSPLLGESLLFSLPTGTKMFQFPALAPCSCTVMSTKLIGLSHSEISGSKVICTSPELIAAYHVLHRLREPRHPPCALSFFI